MSTKFRNSHPLRSYQPFPKGVSVNAWRKISMGGCAPYSSFAGIFKSSMKTSIFLLIGGPKTPFLRLSSFPSMISCDWFAVVLAEKANATSLFDQMLGVARELLAVQSLGAPRRAGQSAAAGGGGAVFARQLVASAQYGAALSRIVEGGFRVMVAGYNCDRAGRDPACYRQSTLTNALGAYDSAWAMAAALHSSAPFSASMYVDYYRSGHAPPVAGLGDTVMHYRNLSTVAARSG